MGFSCTAAAAYVLDAISDEVAGLGLIGSNSMPNGGFWERGREKPDGAITGTVWRLLTPLEKARFAHLDNLDTRVMRRGSFRIDLNGKVLRFPGLSRALLNRAEIAGAAKYQRLHGPNPTVFDWRRTRDVILACLQQPAALPVEQLWDDVQAVAAAYQREAGVAFLALPTLCPADVRLFLNNLN